MNNNLLSADLVQIISQALTNEIHAVGLYADMAERIKDPNLRTLMYSIIGDEYGHARFLALLLILNGDSIEEHRTRLEEIGEALQKPPV